MSDDEDDGRSPIERKQTKSINSIMEELFSCPSSYGETSVCLRANKNKHFFSVKYQKLNWIHNEEVMLVLFQDYTNIRQLELTKARHSC